MKAVDAAEAGESAVSASVEREAQDVLREVSGGSLALAEALAMIDDAATDGDYSPAKARAVQVRLRALLAPTPPPQPPVAAATKRKSAIGPAAAADSPEAAEAPPLPTEEATRGQEKATKSCAGGRDSSPVTSPEGAPRSPAAAAAPRADRARTGRSPPRPSGGGKPVVGAGRGRAPGLSPPRPGPAAALLGTAAATRPPVGRGRGRAPGLSPPRPGPGSERGADAAGAGTDGSRSKPPPQRPGRPPGRAGVASPPRPRPAPPPPREPESLGDGAVEL